jgi:hypothetical protein
MDHVRLLSDVVQSLVEQRTMDHVRLLSDVVQSLVEQKTMDHVRLLSDVVQSLVEQRDNSAVVPNPSQIKWRLKNISAKLQEAQLCRKKYCSPEFEVNFSGSSILYIKASIEGNRLGLCLYIRNINTDILSNKNNLNVGGSSFTITKSRLPDKKKIFSDNSILNPDHIYGWKTFMNDMRPYIDNDSINITLDLKLKITNETLELNE